MSLNWQASKSTSDDLLTITTVYKGKKQEPTMHPVLHRLVFLTLRLGADLTGKSQTDVIQRIALLRAYAPDLVTLQYDDDADKHIAYFHDGRVIKFLDYYPNAYKGKDGGWNVPIDHDWVHAYWGLSTNADRLSFKKWAAREAKAYDKRAA